MRLLALTLLFVGLIAAPASAVDFTVNAIDDDGNGVCSDGDCTLRDAVTQAGASDRVNLPAGTYLLEEGQLPLTGDTIVGAGARDTIIDADGNDRVFHVASGVNRIAGVTVMNGDGFGTAPLNGIGGGILVGPGAGLTLVESTVRDNQAHQGGGIGTIGTLTVVRSTLTDNHAFGATSGAQGGAIWSNSTSTLRNSTVSGNDATNGEVANAQGGGIQLVGGAFTAQSATISGNQANFGSAMSRDPEVPATITVSRTIIDSPPGDPLPCNVGPFSGTLNVVDHTSCGTATGEPQLGPLADNGGPTDTHDLGVNSPAVDTGGASCPVDDQRGYARPAGTSCDVGAVERGAEAQFAALRVVTQVVNDSGGTASPASFAVHVRRDDIDVAGSPAAGTAQGRNYDLSVGDYTVAGAAASGYTSSVGGGCAPGGAISLATDDDEQCVVTFDDVAPPPPSGGGNQQPPPLPGDDDQLPEPQAGESVNVLVTGGTVKVKQPGSKRFRTLSEDEQLPVGTTVDTLKGRVTIVAAGGQSAVFYGGIFKIGQDTGTKPLTTLKLVEKLSCAKRGKASAAAKRKKKRRLWGDGKGRFRTDGEFSSATVRGTKWLVEDRCASTLTRVVKGSVSVRDKVKRKNVIVRAGKKYVAKAER